MPKLKRPYDKYEKLKVLLNGYMGAAEMDMTTLAAAAFPELKQGRLKVAADLRDPGRIKLEDLVKYTRALGIPAEDIRAAIPMI